MIHYFKETGIFDAESLRGLSNEKFKSIIEKHSDLMEILNLKDLIDHWKRNHSQSNVPDSVNPTQDEVENDLGTSSRDSVNLKRKATFHNSLCSFFLQYFMRDFNGRVISAKFKKDALLSTEQRGHIIRSADEYLILDIADFPDEYPRDSEYKSVASEILEHFPGLFTLDTLIGLQ